jgi:formyltetrahydrofolate hydrolase
MSSNASREDAVIRTFVLTLSCAQRPGIVQAISTASAQGHPESHGERVRFEPTAR